MKCAPAYRLEVVGNFPRYLFGRVSQNGNLLKLKPFTREGLPEQSSQLRVKSKNRKASKKTKKKKGGGGTQHDTDKERLEKLPLSDSPEGKSSGVWLNVILAFLTEDGKRFFF